MIFQSNMSKHVSDESEKTVISLLSDNANQVSSVLDNQIKSIWAHMKIIGNSMKVIEEMSPEKATELLNGIFPLAFRAQLATVDGEYIDDRGKRGYIDPDDEMLELFSGGERICTLRQDGMQDSIMFAMEVAPAVIDGKEYRFVLAYYTLDSFMDVISVDSYVGEGQIRVLNENGFVIMSTDNIEKDKQSYYFFKVYEDAKFLFNEEYDDFEGFRHSVLDGDNYAVHVVSDGNEDKVISYAKATQIDFYVTIVVDYIEVLGGLDDTVGAIGMSSIFFTMGVVVIALLLVAYISNDSYKLRQEKMNLEELYDSLDKSKQFAEEALTIAEDANKAKSFFLSNMSHDIRTPMNAITGLNTLIAKNADNPKKVADYSAKISAASRQLLGLINDVLDMSKIESGKTMLHLQEEAVGDIISDVETMIAPQMREKNHSFTIEAGDVVHENVIVDRTRIRQILMNLLSNAVKYTPDGGDIRFTFSEIDSNRSNATYRIVVEDNGCGMSPEFVQNIYNVFTRERDGRTSKIQGTGLGMAITKQLVDLMGGTIEVESRKDEGTVFTIVLQFQLAESQDTPAFWEERSIRRALVVGDREAVCRNIALSMRNAGVSAECAFDKEHAFSLAGGEDFQLVILDWREPDLTLADIIRGLRGMLPQDSLIILLISYDVIELENYGFSNMIDGAISKPFFMNTLRRKVEEIIERRGEKERIRQDRSIFAGKRVMIVEDNELNCEIFSELLADLGAECVDCDNGLLAVEAFEHSAEGYFDVIFMDVQMPVMNGYEAARAIRRSSHPDAKRVPIIAVTADAFTEDVRAVLDAGMDRHVSKPINMSVVEAVVRQLLS